MRVNGPKFKTDIIAMSGCCPGMGREPENKRPGKVF